MSKIIIAGAGGAPSEGVINSLLMCDKKETVIGMGSEPTDMKLSKAHKKYVVPYANDINYRHSLMQLLRTEKPDMIHFQNDLEIYEASRLRHEIIQQGIKIFMPVHEVIDTCVHKFKSYRKWKSAGVKVPENMLIENENDLKKAFDHLGNHEGKIWLRASSIGGGGKGALPTASYDFAKNWIDHYKGWGDFAAAQMLTPDTVTWQSIWFEGELVVAQTRKRMGWTHGNRTLSGVTGVTKVGMTFSDPVVDGVAIDSIQAIDSKPHGIYGVDMAYDTSGFPNPTEINISRFFTTILFFTCAGLNMPKIFKDIALYNEFPSLSKKINPLPDNLVWLRGMDVTPMLTTTAKLHDDLITAE